MWSFGLCFLDLRNMNGRVWNQKRVHRVCCELAANPRIKPPPRLKSEKPEELTVPEAPFLVWPIGFVAGRSVDEWHFRRMIVLDDFN